MSPELVEQICEWKDGARFDWLHPTHGPFPDLCLLYQDELGMYTVAIWDQQDMLGQPVPGIWLAAACGPECYHQGHLQSYRWEIDQDYKFIRYCCQVTKTRMAYVDVDAEPDDEQVRWLLADNTLKILCREKVDPDWF